MPGIFPAAKTGLGAPKVQSKIKVSLKKIMRIDQPVIRLVAACQTNFMEGSTPMARPTKAGDDGTMASMNTIVFVPKGYEQK